MNEETLVRLCKLSGLRLTDADSVELLQDLLTIKGFVDNIHRIPTENVEPLAHPLDMEQVLRDDIPEQGIDRDRYQQLASDALDGFYLVPRVIEP